VPVDIVPPTSIVACASFSRTVPTEVLAGTQIR
jgi:hypothetical protein